jgi:BTB/POZ domain
MSTNLNKIITFNVGGTIFETRVTTILKESNWALSNMLNDCTSTSNEVVFIDRDPKQFDIILRYLRLGDLDLTSVDLDLLAKEADFFGITSLLRLIDNFHINKAKEEQLKLLNKVMTRMEEYGTNPFLIALFCYYYKLIKPNLGYITVKYPRVRIFISGLLQTCSSYSMFVEEFLYCINNWDDAVNTDCVVPYFDAYYQFNIRSQTITEYFFDLQDIIKKKMYPFDLSPQ